MNVVYRYCDIPPFKWLTPARLWAQTPSPLTLKQYADQLLFNAIFNTSLETCFVPTSFKTSYVVPVPQKARITGLND